MAKKLTQEEYTAAVGMVKRGKEVEVAGRKVTSLEDLNAAMESQDEYLAQVAQIEAGQMVRVAGRTALSLDELHFALNAKPAGPIEFVPAGVPMILGFGEQADANALKATIDEQNGTILALQAEKQGLEAEKAALTSELECVKQAYTSENANADALQLKVTQLTTDCDQKALAITGLQTRIEELEQAAAVAEAAKEQSISNNPEPQPNNPDALEKAANVLAESAPEAAPAAK